MTWQAEQISVLEYTAPHQILVLGSLPATVKCCILQNKYDLPYYSPPPPPRWLPPYWYLCPVVVPVSTYNFFKIRVDPCLGSWQSWVNAVLECSVTGEDTLCITWCTFTDNPEQEGTIVCAVLTGLDWTYACRFVAKCANHYTTEADNNLSTTHQPSYCMSISPLPTFMSNLPHPQGN